MNKQELIKKIIQKKEFSQLPRKDVELAFAKFDKGNYCDEEKIKFTRNLLRNVFSSFTSLKLLNVKNKSPSWVLNKHFSTRERFPHYEEIYKRIFKNENTQGRTPRRCENLYEAPNTLKGTRNIQENIFTKGKSLSVIDLGAGVNGFSYGFFKKLGFDVCYTAIESMGQLVKLMNCYFLENKLNANAIHKSLFEVEKVKEIIKKQKKPVIVFLFKTVDSLEMLEKNYSKKLISEIVPFVDTLSGHENLSRGKFVVSFATKSMGKRKNFRANRKWLVDFIKDNFVILDDFELSGERYLVFRKAKDL